ncbi:citrulline utilization hydrolase CtlX [Hymenobacter glacialis]|uniref:Amidinotransferase n=1 Tax=Hymenobacter glacialis TaxID=1908236 RepID=A0A1G1TBV0_9BACT|nr:arginine deiminase-related protein [Hymenobacter glacialis]OGX88346.1 amidinotransferase [Hymenobacter glacialis]
MSLANTVLMARPASFGFNTETADSNRYQRQLTAAGLTAQVLAEFDAAVATLRGRGVRVQVFDDAPEPAKPDAVFPNNWFSTHADGQLLLYPMCAPNRRSERQPELIAALAREFDVREVVDLSGTEQENRFLEGTGSIIFDHVHRVAYAGLSPRTDAALFEQVAEQLGYRPVAFRATDAQGQEIYHTNVMMCVGPGVAVVCLSSIADATEQAAVVASLTATGHEIVDISQEQVGRFAGNMLALEPAAGGQPLLVMSQQAHDALTPTQRQTLERHAALVPLAIPTIETVGGGSARCMLAEVFLPTKPA